LHQEKHDGAISGAGTSHLSAASVLRIAFVSDYP